jgi:DHA2 family multidrug resistance protein
LAPIAGATLRRVDARVPTAVGSALIGLASYMASGISGDWVSGDFLPPQIIEATGQSFAFTSLVYFSVRNLNVCEALNFGALLQTARLIGGELGSGFMQTFVRIGEEVHSNLIGLHVTAGSFMTDRDVQE